jgi:hypothetical protein
MIPSSLIRKIAALLLLGALLSAPWATAAGPRVPAEPRASGSGLGDLFFQAWSAFAALWGDEGCTLDPNGRCRGAAAVPVRPTGSLDNGCTLDPDGGCLGRR